MQTRHTTPIKNLSRNPAVQAAIDKQIEGYHAYLRGKKLCPNEPLDWRLGWQAGHDGRVLTDRVLRYLMGH